MRRSRCDLSARVEIQQLDGHLLNRHPRTIALLRPSLSAELVQARRGGVSVRIPGGAVPLDLADAIERHVEPVTALVFDDRDLHGARADEDRLEPPIDADAVLEVHDEVPGFESGDRLEGRAGGITPRATQPPLAAEYLVIGENPESI